jgi:hypothetical protein
MASRNFVKDFHSSINQHFFSGTIKANTTVFRFPPPRVPFVDMHSVRQSSPTKQMGQAQLKLSQPTAIQV